MRVIGSVSTPTVPSCSEGVSRWPSIKVSVRLPPKLRRLRTVRFWYAWRGNDEPENTGILSRASDTEVGVICESSSFEIAVRGVGELAIFEITRDPVTTTVSVDSGAFCAEAGPAANPAQRAIADTVDLYFESMPLPSF